MASNGRTAPAEDVCYFKYNATDPTDTQRLRDSFQQQLLERWDTVEERVLEWFDGAGEVDYERFQLEFRTWFENTIFSNVLQQTPDSDINNGRHWTASYVRDAYQQGLTLAESDLQRVDVSQRAITQATKFFADYHQSRITQQYQRAYVGLADQIHRLVSEVMTEVREGVDNRENRDWFQESVIDRIEKVGKNQAKAHGNTVVVDTVNEALLTTFEAAGVDEVGVLPESSSAGSVTVNYASIRVNQPDEGGGPETFAEAIGSDDSDPIPDPDDPREPDEVAFVTAGDEDVCPQCRALEGTTVNIGKARSSEGALSGAGPRSVIPVHPNCRCRWVPVMTDGGAALGPPRDALPREQPVDVEPQDVSESRLLDTTVRETEVDEDLATAYRSGRLHYDDEVTVVHNGELHQNLSFENVELRDDDDSLPSVIEMSDPRGETVRFIDEEGSGLPMDVTRIIRRRYSVEQYSDGVGRGLGSFPQSQRETIVNKLSKYQDTVLPDELQFITGDINHPRVDSDDVMGYAAGHDLSLPEDERLGSMMSYLTPTRGPIRSNPIDGDVFADDHLSAEFQKGAHATADMEDVTEHEFGHLLHFRRMSDADTTPQFDDAKQFVMNVRLDRDQHIFEEVSAYATTNRAEFVAEVWTKMQRGEVDELADDVIELYERLNGPDPFDQL
jgi:hypothetical protein